MTNHKVEKIPVVEKFEWSDVDVDVLENSGRTPKSVAQAAKLLVVRNCDLDADECRLRGTVTPDARSGTFVCQPGCEGPAKAVAYFDGSLAQAHNTQQESETT